MLIFHKSSKCESTHCVGVARADAAYVRDLKLGSDDVTLRFDPQDWMRFVEWLKDGR